MDNALPLPGNVEAHLESRPEDFTGGQWLLVDINMKQFDGRAERINITMPRRLLVKIDPLSASILSSVIEAHFWLRQHVACCLGKD